jgi:hypothetical protein
VFFGNYHRSKGFDIKINDIINNMKITGLKRDSFLKTGIKASHSKFVGTTERDDQKRDNSILNWTSVTLWHKYTALSTHSAPLIRYQMLFGQRNLILLTTFDTRWHSPVEMFVFSTTFISYGYRKHRH